MSRQPYGQRCGIEDGRLSSTWEDDDDENDDDGIGMRGLFFAMYCPGWWFNEATTLSSFVPTHSLQTRRMHWGHFRRLEKMPMLPSHREQVGIASQSASFT
ncbi:hypothetical protein H257_09929 [Aphanomyces astaci]|uniref:Uncharacterized protein n=1 Tax=Aphanomyces astaci TaxID=112090 RepID=W4G8G7_APHAT|nr:hypothetical protein H257_09929 [Aphanomyces astaci]ETV75975.1 hypothetical protein H257_09929 [Aphanomyces astaci]|eukprot:XP_009834617.1 hypothetical protein H257_09929 [Aphanomyces astaci]